LDKYYQRTLPLTHCDSAGCICDFCRKIGSTPYIKDKYIGYIHWVCILISSCCTYELPYAIPMSLFYLLLLNRYTPSQVNALDLWWISYCSYNKYWDYMIVSLYLIRTNMKIAYRITTFVLATSVACITMFVTLLIYILVTGLLCVSFPIIMGSALFVALDQELLVCVFCTIFLVFIFYKPALYMGFMTKAWL
jgi:hypothetical protein